MITQDEIIDKDEVLKMARQADEGFEGGTYADGTMPDSIVGIAAVIRFAKLVAAQATAKEREACAKICENLPAALEEFDALGRAADAIRARGETTSRGEA